MTEGEEGFEWVAAGGSGTHGHTMLLRIIFTSKQPTRGGLWRGQPWKQPLELARNLAAGGPSVGPPPAHHGSIVGVPRSHRSGRSQGKR